MKKISFLFVFFFYFSANAQEVKRIELPLSATIDNYHPIPIGDKGLLVLAQTSRSSFGLLLFDKNLEQQWVTNGTIDEKLDYATSFYDGKNVYLLFSKFESNVYQVVKVYLGPGIIESFDIYSIDKIKISDFKAHQDVIYIAGSARLQPVILRTDLVNQNTKVLPTALKSEAELQSIEIDSTNGNLMASFLLKKGKNYDILLKTFDGNGRQISQVIFEPDSELAFINGKLSHTNDSLQFLIGTYGFRNQQTNTNNISQGLFLNKLSDGEPATPTYYSFADFTNFFNFMKDKERERMEKKIEKKRGKGDELKLNYRLLVHNIIQKKDGFYVVAEAFYPEYRYINNNGYGGFAGNGIGSAFSPFGSGFNSFYNPYGWGWGRSILSNSNFGWGSQNALYNNNGKIFDGFVYTHAIVAEFDKNGKMIWDNSIEIKDLKTNSLKERVKASVVDDKVTLSYILGGKILRKTFKDAKRINEFDEISVIPEDTNVKVRRSENEDLEFWYDKYAIAWGNQKLSGDPSRRSVFFINKIEF